MHMASRVAPVMAIWHQNFFIRPFVFAAMIFIAEYGRILFLSFDVSLGKPDHIPTSEALINAYWEQIEMFKEVTLIKVSSII